MPENGFLVLKAPQIAVHLDRFAGVFPEATFLYLHRDPWQKRGGRAQPRQEMSDHGYTRRQVESDPSLASYLQRYQVVLEPTRHTG